jgi:hypothetical protein
MRKILMTGFAALLLAACSSEDVSDAPSAQQGAVEQRYMAISLVANDISGTRADDGTEASTTTTTAATTLSDGGTSYNYTEGSGDEYSVSTNNIVFFLFKDGQPYHERNAANGTNRITDIYDNPDTWTLENSTKQILANVIIIVDEPEGEGQPNQIVAVINDPKKGEDFEGLTLDEMRVKLIEQSANYSGSADNFVMSNSAYATNENGGIQYVYASVVTQDNLKLTEPDAEANPVTVYVERVVAKVTSDEQGKEIAVDVDGNAGTTLQIIALDDKGDQKLTNSGTITAKILGWNVFNKAYNANIVKNITGYSASWAWNSSELCRSYWANPVGDLKESAKRLTWDQMREGGADYKVYPFESTKFVGDDVNATSVIFAAQLLENGKPADVARWRGNYYRRAAVKAAISKFWSKKLYKKDENGNLVSITASDIKFKVQADGYHLHAIVTGAWYDREGNQYEQDELDSITKENGYVQIWQNGKSYYYTTIQHPQISAGSEDWVNALVRNHWYQISIKTITGLGTPVPVPNPDPNDPNYDPDDPSNPVPEPTDPSEVDPNNPNPDDPGDIINPDPKPDPTDPDDPKWKDPDDPEKDPDPDKPVDPDNPYPIDPVRPDDDDEDDAWLLDAKIVIQPWRIVTNSANLYSKEKTSVK